MSVPAVAEVMACSSEATSVTSTICRMPLGAWASVAAPPAGALEPGAAGRVAPGRVTPDPPDGPVVPVGVGLAEAVETVEAVAEAAEVADSVSPRLVASLLTIGTAEVDWGDALEATPQPLTARSSAVSAAAYRPFTPTR